MLVCEWRMHVCGDRSPLSTEVRPRCHVRVPAHVRGGGRACLATTRYMPHRAALAVWVLLLCFYIYTSSYDVSIGHSHQRHGGASA